MTAVIAKLSTNGYASKGKVVIEGISRGALVAGLVAASDKLKAGIVLISGLFDLPRFTADPKTAQAKLVAQSIVAKTGGGGAALRARSIINFVPNIKADVRIMNGAMDDRTDPEQARLLAAKINSHGGTARVIVYPEYGHQIPVRAREWCDRRIH